MIRLLIPVIILLSSNVAMADDFPSVCSRSAPVYAAILNAIPAKMCSRITAADLAFIQTLDIRADDKPLTENDLVGLSRLKELRFWSGKTAITRRLMQPLKSLKQLFLVTGEVSLDSDAFDDLSNLEDLTLFYASNVAPALSKLYALRSLQTNSQFIGDSIWPALKDHTKLETLVLPDAGITYIDNQVLKQFANLRQLNLNGNEIGSSLTATTFSAQSKLEMLQLRGTVIHHLDPQMTRPLGSLKTLDLTGNFIRKVDREFFLPLTQLKELSLADTLLTHIEAGTFDSLVNINFIDLSINAELDKIDDFAFTKIGSNLELNLRESSLRNTNKAAFFGVSNIVDIPRTFEQSPGEWGDR